MATRSCLCAFLLFLVFAFQSPIIRANIFPLPPRECRQLSFATLARFEFLSQLIQLRTEFLLRSSIGVGINDISPGLIQGGPAPIGAAIATLDNVTRGIIEQFGLNGVGHLRAIVDVTALNPPLPRPLIDVRAEAFANVLGLGGLVPPFNVYNNRLRFLLAANLLTNLLVQYEGAIAPAIIGNDEQRLLSGIERTNAAELGVIRAQLYASVNATVPPYTLTVRNLTDIIAETVNLRGRCDVKEEGLIVPLQLGAQNRTTVNVVPADVNSLAFTRIETEVLRIIFATANATITGGLLPSGLFGAAFRLILALRLG
ncbi:hypothetical protein F3Y22_tig00112614pilonHSYRG00109 [Hibiscus syriacus]|uniref:Desiccation-related protein PCC13-62 n=1 Tax=Hibiscus syriacus TaxID=106335 RepID=A0A6A2WW06_HIBSY|nr:hypothetical protein F3Y22_tig00112614pilonHSYRG00109 [Hibiscus syriacus]